MSSPITGEELGLLGSRRFTVWGSECRGLEFRCFLSLCLHLRRNAAYTVNLPLNDCICWVIIQYGIYVLNVSKRNGFSLADDAYSDDGIVEEGSCCKPHPKPWA